MTVDERVIATHLLACVQGLYRHWGECAPNFTNDTFVVCAYEGARRFGEVALAWRDALGDVTPGRVGPVDEVLTLASADATGTMSLYAVAVVVGPRLLVSVRDAQALVHSDAWAALLNATADATVAQMHRVQDAMQRSSPLVDEEWQVRARGLADALDASGMAETLGFGG